MSLTYNSQEEPLALKEYGRNIQRMVKHAMTLEDKEERTRAAETIIHIMTQINPSVKENSDFKHKLWDHLYLISGFELDVEGPFEKPSPEDINSKPKRIPYPKHRLRYRHYGRNVERMLQAAVDEQDPELRQRKVNSAAAYMKLSYGAWNDDKATDEMIIDHVRELSGGLLKPDRVVDLASMVDASKAVPANAPIRTNKKKKRKRKKPAQRRH